MPNFSSFDDFWTWGDGIFRSLCLALLVLVLFWVAGSLIHRKLGPALLRRIDHDKHPIAVQLLKGFHLPTSIFFKVAGICCALLVLTDQLENELLPRGILQLLKVLPPILEKSLRIALIIAVSWGLIASSDVTALILRRARNKLDIHMSKGVARFLSAISNVVVIAVAAVILLSEFDYDINGLVAGLGLGGLTVALAAKDSAANFFGGLVLVMEKPFEIGDWIVCDEVEGAVEDINLRSTLIRTPSGSLTTMPNATLAGAPITNWGGGMEKRRADFTLNLTYGSPPQSIRAFTEAVRTMLETDHDVISDSIVVRFTDLAASSLDIRVVFYTSLPGFADHLQVRERVNFALLDLAKRNGLSFAYPTTSVYLEKEKLEGSEGEAAGKTGSSKASTAKTDTNKTGGTAQKGKS